MDLSNLLNSVLGDERILQEMSRKVGAQPEEVRKAATLGMPTLVEAIDRNAREERKRDSLAKALEDHQNDDVENLEGFINHVDVDEVDVVCECSAECLACGVDGGYCRRVSVLGA